MGGQHTGECQQMHEGPTILYYCTMRERVGAKNECVGEQSACLRADRLTETDTSVIDGAVAGKL